MSGFVKIYGSKLITSSLWDEAPEARLVFLALLSIADATGFVDVPNERALARVLNLDQDYVERALAVLMAPDTGSRTKTQDGRRILREDAGWRCVNYEKYREFRTATQEANRVRVERHRAKAGVTRNDRNGDVTPVTTEAEADLEAESRADPERAPVPDTAGTERDESEMWNASRWLAKFKIAWERGGVVGGTPFYGDSGDTKACATLQGELERLPADVRAAAQALAPQMFEAFLTSGDWKAQKRKFPFVFFVQEFGSLRQPKARRADDTRPLP